MSDASADPSSTKPRRSRKKTAKKAAKKAPRKSTPKPSRAPVNRRKPWHVALASSINRLVLIPSILEVIHNKTAEGVTIKSPAHLHACFEVHFDCSLAREIFDEILPQTGIRFTAGVQIDNSPSGNPAVTNLLSRLPSELLTRAEQAKQHIEDDRKFRDIPPTGDIPTHSVQHLTAHNAQPEGDDRPIVFTNEAPSDQAVLNRSAASIHAQQMAMAEAAGENPETIIIPRPR